MRWRLEEVWLWLLKSRLEVNRALFGRNDKKGEEKKGEAAKSNSVKVGGGNNAFVNGRSFKGVVVSEVGKEVGLGKEVPCLDFLPSEEMLDFLKEGYVADLVQSYTAREVQQALAMESWSNIQVIGMGERQVLLQLKDTCGVVELVRKKNEMWWSLMFKRVRRWYPNMVEASRVVWLSVYGIPLHVWDEPFFKKLCSLFGRFDDFDEETIGRKSFEVARIRVSTARKAIIDEEVKIRMMGAEFVLWVVEDGRGRWCPRRKEGMVIDDVTEVGSRKVDMLREERGFSSEDEVASYGSHKSMQLESRNKHLREDNTDESEEKMDVQEDVERGSKSFVSLKGDQVLYVPVGCGQVAMSAKDVDGRGKELDRCIRWEGASGGAQVSLAIGRRGEESHARAANVKSVLGGGHEGEVPGLDLGRTLSDEWAQAHLGEENINTPVAGNGTEAQTGSVLQQVDVGCFEKDVLQTGNSNQHIRFVYEESDKSEYIDSIHEFDGDEQRLLKIRQKSRKKKKQGSLEKKQLVVGREGQVTGCLKAGKRRIHHSSKHRRVYSLQEGCEVYESENDEGVAWSLDLGCYSSFPSIKGHKGSGIELLSSPVEGRRELNKLAAKKVLTFQKGVGVSHSMKEGPIMINLWC